MLGLLGSQNAEVSERGLAFSYSSRKHFARIKPLKVPGHFNTRNSTHINISRTSSAPVSLNLWLREREIQETQRARKGWGMQRRRLVLRRAGLNAANVPGMLREGDVISDTVGELRKGFLRPSHMRMEGMRTETQ